MKEMNNCNANNNADNEFINGKKHREKKRNFNVTENPRAQSWDPTPDTAEEQVNTYGTYEIQATADSEFDFPAISQGLPSEKIAPKPKSFYEGIIPELNDSRDVDLL
ncbi:MAG: hypothetical protein J6S13_09190 [Clostridia bacterium]|nr:hypothetical protein [Clostridia bacterium]